jgi:hypothetical protein
MKSYGKTRGIAAVAFSLTVFLTSCFLVAAESVPPEVIRAAREGLPRFLEAVPRGQIEKFGFAPDDRIELARPGVPFLLYTITPAALSSGKDSIGSLISPTGKWYFPVMLGGEAKSVLTVDRMDGSWQAVGLGKAALARELQEILRRWPRAKGYDPRLVVVYQAASYFFTVPQEGDDNLTPLLFDGKGFGAELHRGDKKYSSLIKFPEIAGLLRAAVEENIQQGY